MFAAKNDIARQITTKDVIHLENVGKKFLLEENRLVKVWRGVMDGNAVAVRKPKTNIFRPDGVTTIDVGNVSAFFHSSNKLCTLDEIFVENSQR